MQLELNLPNDEPTNTSKMFISFGYTADRLLSGQKTVTRRLWKLTHMARILKTYKQGEWLRALNKSFYAGGHQIGWLKLKKPPYLEALSEITQSDCAAEGYPELTPQEFRDRFFKGLRDRQEVWVVEFEFRPIKPSSNLALNQDISQIPAV